MIGWAPRNSAGQQANWVAGRVSDNSVIERYQGGSYAAMGYSRANLPAFDVRLKDFAALDCRQRGVDHCPTTAPR